ncbi:MAG: helix-turn-helix domain-containing protein [Sphingomonas sp.]|nr:helix-turn-helix domain-containing protein [Sphingomonas sp.]
MEIPTILLTVSEAAQHLRLSRSSFYNLIKAGEVETVLIGGRRLVKTASVRRLAQIEEE